MKTFKTIKSKFLLAILFAFCGSYSLLNAQVEVTSNGTVNIGNTAEPLFDIYTRFQINMDAQEKAIMKSVGVDDQTGKQSVTGFQFFPEMFVITGGPSSYTGKEGIMTLTGLDNKRANIGSFSNNIFRIYSHELYLNGVNLGPIILSDVTFKTNIRELPSISERLQKLRPVVYDFAKDGSGDDVSKYSAYKNRVGFIAQEIKDIFPDLVTIDEKGLHRLDYAGLIPYLTKTIQEQNETIQIQNDKIENLQQQINDIQNGVYTADFVIDGEEMQPSKAPKTAQQNEIDNILYQNAPNPFNISTTIKYQLSDNATNAKICIYNLTGKQLQCYNLQATKGENSIEVRASSLQSGMYLYSLIVDDKLVSTKRMVLTE
jgi:hypothetical protein